MKQILLPILVIGILLLSACGSPSTTPPTEAPHATSPTGQPTTSEEPEPTSPPTTIPQPTPEPEPIEFSGEGDDVSSEFMLEEGVTIITMTHDGDSNFAIELLDDTGGYVDLLVNEIGSFDGTSDLTP
jgi:hypothetical protein